MMWTDSHLHLDDPAFDPDRDDVIARAQTAGVGRFVCVGTSWEGSRRAIALAACHPQVWATVGIHPQNAGGASDQAVAALRGLARHSRVVAVGETGLDYARPLAAPGVQAAAFRAQIRLARDLGLPVVVHNREAHEDVERILREEGAAGVIMHCFIGSPDIAERWAGFGWMLSFAGPLTFARSESLREAARRVPDDRLLVETDAPYLAPVPVRGRRCEPAFVVHTARMLAQARGVAEDALAVALDRNTAGVFWRMVRGTLKEKASDAEALGPGREADDRRAGGPSQPS